MEYINKLVNAWMNIECRWVTSEFKDLKGKHIKVCDKLYFSSREVPTKEVLAISQDFEGNYWIINLKGEIEFFRKATRVRILGTIRGQICEKPNPSR